MDKIKQWTNYIIIGVISFLALVFLPMIGSAATVGIILPTTFAGWTVWIVTKMIVATINILIFHCFIMEGKDRGKLTEEYKKAQELMKIVNPRIKRKLISPEEWTSREYKRKGIWVFLTSALSVFALSQAILSYDWISMLTYLFVIIFGIIFGVLEQKRVLEKWSFGYLEYAEWLIEEKAEAESVKILEETPIISIDQDPPQINEIILEESQ